MRRFPSIVRQAIESGRMWGVILGTLIAVHAINMASLAARAARIKAAEIVAPGPQSEGKAQ